MDITYKLRHSARRRWRSRIGACVIFLTGAIFAGLSYAAGGVPDDTPRESLRSAATSRHLLGELANCTPAAIEKFPHVGIIFDQQTRRQGAVILHVLLAAYMFLALAIVCDDYFVPSCEIIASRLRLQEDVAGATFLAAGSSAPELATTVIGVFITKDDIALGAVVGSAVFNVMLVPGLCAVCATTVLYLRWWPLFRDSFFYMISIIALLLIMVDSVITWYDALFLVLMYVVYIVVMYFNPSLDEYFTNRCTCMPKPRDPEVLPLQIKSDDHEHTHYDRVDVDAAAGTPKPAPGDSVYTSLLSTAYDDDMVMVTSMEDTKHTSPNYEDKSLDNVEDEQEENSMCTFPSGVWARFVWIISLPLQVLLFISVPDCRTDRWKNWFIFSFILSMMWIGIFSYIMVWMITLTGHTVGIPDTVMGLTFIAAGSSVPDAIASLIVVHEGHGDMAMSNAVASNVFDILLCLGLPWLLQTTIGEGRHTGITIYSNGLLYCACTLLSTVVFLLVATHLNGWKFTKKYGVVLICIYVLFNILASLYELNIFTYVHPPECPTDI